ncbi:hypothetical protein GCM10023322_74880 [Rugosimonospora acidiphila]|uniref:Uncharacterized protein n=1 Tax=Rugosimonospora acidiphila TaxID=556531 RepID=A0ABP9SMX9_9ACTN
MQMMGLRHPAAHLGTVREPVAVDHGDPLDMVGQGARDAHPGEAPTDHDGVTRLDSGHRHLLPSNRPRCPPYRAGPLPGGTGRARLRQLSCPAAAGRNSRPAGRGSSRSVAVPDPWQFPIRRRFRRRPTKGPAGRRPKGRPAAAGGYRRAVESGAGA